MSPLPFKNLKVPGTVNSTLATLELIAEQIAFLVNVDKPYDTSLTRISLVSSAKYIPSLNLSMV